MTILRGMDHVGLTVTDIEVAHAFLVDGLDAELVYELVSASDPPIKGRDMEQLVAVPAGTEIDRIRMYKLHDGPAIELFHYKLQNTSEQRPALRACDVGFQHLAFYVDDMEAAIDKLVAAGGRRMADPWDMLGPESGPANRFCFIMSPFGALIELVTYPSEQLYRKGNSLSRWQPAA